MYTDHTSPHKLYLHLNKDHYNSGEVIWFKAYLVDATTHRPDTGQVNIYVDLIDSEGVVMGKRILLAGNGTAVGDISLPSSIPDGNYMLRAYTSWMKNFDESFFFKKYLYINNPDFRNSIPRLKAWSNRRFNRKLERLQEDYRISFFPEGGNLVGGVNTRIAFRSEDALGRGVQASGEILDGRGEIITLFETSIAGTGVFELLPAAGESYRARVNFPGERPRLIDLPEVSSHGVGIKVVKGDDSLFVEFECGMTPFDRCQYDDLFLIAHTRGIFISGRSFSLDEGRYAISLPSKLFPTGIAHITLFSCPALPLAERLVFIDHRDSFSFYPEVVRQVIDGRDHFGLLLEVSDKNNNPVSGSFSVSLVASESEIPLEDDNILSHTLLSSDIGSRVYNPSKYFNANPGYEEFLDQLMLTLEWDRFSWNSIITGEIPDMEYPHSASLSISGRVTDPARDESLSNYPVELALDGEGEEVYTTQTNSRGVFEFTELVYYDETRARLSSKRLRDNYPPDIELFRSQTEGFEYVPNMYTRRNRITSRGSNWRRVPRVTSSPYSEAPELKALPRLYGVPDQTIFIDVRTVRQNTVYEVLLHNARGMDIDGGRISFRGRTDLYGVTEPMFILDGVRSGRDVILKMSPFDVQRIEIFRGTSKAVFGSTGSAGAIVVYSRRAADDGFSDYEEYILTGYHTPNDFYSDIGFQLSGPSAERFSSKAIKWEPEVVTDENGQALIPVPSIEGVGPVKLVIEGTGFDGGFGSGTFILNFNR